MTDTLYRTSLPISAVEGRTLSGVALPFDRPTDVQDLVRGRPGPKYKEAFAPTSANRSLSHNMSFPSFVGHDHTTQPIGVVHFSVSDLERALMFDLGLSKTRLSDECLELANDGAMNSVSIGFRPLADQRNRMVGNELVECYRTEVALRHLALAPTGYGQYEEAQVLSIREEGVDPGGLMQAVDASLDSAQDAFDGGNPDQARALVSAAQNAIDALMALFKVEDADEPELLAARSVHIEEIVTRCSLLTVAFAPVAPKNDHLRRRARAGF